MEKTIYLKEVLAKMHTPDAEGRAVTFDMAVRTLNKYSKAGGKLNRYKNAKLVMVEKGKDRDSIYALQHFKPSETKERVRKNPHHFDNKTRNIRLEDGKVRKIHFLHIIEFNGKKVIY